MMSARGIETSLVNTSPVFNHSNCTLVCMKLKITSIFLFVMHCWRMLFVPKKKKKHFGSHLELKCDPLACNSSVQKNSVSRLDLNSGPLTHNDNQIKSPSCHQDLHEYQPPLKSFQQHIGPLNLKKTIHANLNKLDGVSDILQIYEASL